MPKKQNVFADYDDLKEVVQKIPNAPIKPTVTATKLDQLAAKKKASVDYVTVFDDATGVLSAVARVGSTEVPLGTANIERIVAQQARMDALQYLKKEGCLEEAHLAAVWLRSMRVERRVHEIAVRNLQAAKIKAETLKLELKEALKALDIAEMEAASAAKGLALQ